MRFLTLKRNVFRDSIEDSQQPGVLGAGALNPGDKRI